ncbi:hypothetical protein BJ912DRAFT_1134087 [Pholiota molesta]|nr:hypothetical protein BJ912DRAFT_1134087 [Pholiota molesta]
MKLMASLQPRKKLFQKKNPTGTALEPVHNRLFPKETAIASSSGKNQHLSTSKPTNTRVTSVTFIICHTPSFQNNLDTILLGSTGRCAMLISLNRALLKICNPTFGIFKSRKSTVESSSSQTVVGQKETSKEIETQEVFHPYTTPSNPAKPLWKPAAPRSCLSQLPPEIMGEIFARACHATTHNFHSDTRRHLRTTPFILGHVCTDWREIVWSTPHIWSHLALVLSTTLYETQMVLLRDWLGRSGVCPLHISLLFGDEHDWSDRIPNELIEMLVETSHRWRSIYFVLPEAWYSGLAKIESKLPLLVEASTQPLWSDCGLPSASRKHFTLLQSAPALKDMRLNGYYLAGVQIPWAQLTSIKMQQVYLDECLYGLLRTTNATFCRIFTILANDVGRIVQDFPERLQLPITELIIYMAAWADTERLLSNFSLPSLKTLELSALNGPPEVNNLPSLLLNLNCQLHTLKLTEFDCYEEEFNLIDALQQIPSLRSLEINLNQGSSVVGCDFFPRLLQLRRTTSQNDCKGDSSTKTLLGKLEDFKFSGTVFSANSPLHQSLVQALRLRATSSCLRSFELTTTLVYDYPLDVEIKKEFRELRRRGLRLKIAFRDISWLA